MGAAGEPHDVAADSVPDAASGDALAIPEPTSERYPDYRMPFVGQQELGPTDVAEAVESFLLGYGYNTARAYRADLEDIYIWAIERGMSFLALTDRQFMRYQTLLRRRGYSESTIRRRRTAYNRLLQATNKS